MEHGTEDPWISLSGRIRSFRDGSAREAMQTPRSVHSARSHSSSSSGAGRESNVEQQDSKHMALMQSIEVGRSLLERVQFIAAELEETQAELSAVRLNLQGETERRIVVENENEELVRNHRVTSQRLIKLQEDKRQLDVILLCYEEERQAGVARDNRRVEPLRMGALEVPRCPGKCLLSTDRNHPLRKKNSIDAAHVSPFDQPLFQDGSFAEPPIWKGEDSKDFEIVGVSIVPISLERQFPSTSPVPKLDLGTVGGGPRAVVDDKDPDGYALDYEDDTDHSDADGDNIDSENLENNKAKCTAVETSSLPSSARCCRSSEIYEMLAQISELQAQVQSQKECNTKLTLELVEARDNSVVKGLTRPASHSELSSIATTGIDDGVVNISSVSSRASPVGSPEAGSPGAIAPVSYRSGGRVAFPATPFPSVSPASSRYSNVVYAQAFQSFSKIAALMDELKQMAEGVSRQCTQTMSPSQSKGSSNVSPMHPHRTTTEGNDDLDGPLGDFYPPGHEDCSGSTTDGHLFCSALCLIKTEIDQIRLCPSIVSSSSSINTSPASVSRLLDAAVQTDATGCTDSSVQISDSPQLELPPCTSCCVAGCMGCPSSSGVKDERHRRKDLYSRLQQLENVMLTPWTQRGAALKFMVEQMRGGTSGGHASSSSSHNNCGKTCEDTSQHQRTTFRRSYSERSRNRFSTSAGAGSADGFTRSQNG